MHDPSQSGGETLPIPQGEGPGGRIGPFKILQQLGEGGFGSVFEAEQEQPVRRRVALKVIKLGMDTREVIARFEAERQALALMDHPHIARVLDAGATDSGRPYFVMELVKGEPIAGYCRKRKLSVVQRLQLFDQVCAAVQHAHTKGIIHRDLKPNNVLVSTQDDAPFARVIDFGIAKATSGRLTDRTLFTEANLMMGTPLYMSPEQAEGSADIDTRTDIYALGVILYELLTDTTPLDSNTLRAAGYAEIQRIIREVEPPRPSARLSKSSSTTLGAEARQRDGARKLTKMVHGELDWIAMKAIEKDRARRYETANALAMDIRRYLAGEAVLAAPPGALYRMRKFVRRHKGGVAAGSLVAASLLAGIVAFAWQARIAQQQARIAEQQARIAQQRSAELDQIAKFESAMIGQVDPTVAGKLLSDDVQAKYAAALVKQGVPEAQRIGQVAAFAAQWRRVNATDTARDLFDSTILKPAVATIDRQFKDSPSVNAFLKQSLADRYVSMGLFDAALPLQESALATRRRVEGDGAVTLGSVLNMGVLWAKQGKFAQAEPYFREAAQKSPRILGAQSPDTLTAISDLGLALSLQGKLAQAEPYERQALAIRRSTLGEDNRYTLVSIMNLGELLRTQKKWSEAEPLLREAVRDMLRVLGPEHPHTLGAMLALGALLADEGKLDEAGTYDSKTLETARRALGENDALTLSALIETGRLLEKQDKHDAVVKLLAPSEEAVRKAFAGGDTNRLAMFLMQLGKARTGLGAYADAETRLLEAHDVFGRDHGATQADDLRECVRAIVALYDAWNAANPGKGYAAKSAEWKRELDALAMTEK